MAAPPKPMTADELLRRPDDVQRHELVRGELRTMSPSGGQHSRLAAFIAISLGKHVLARQLGAVFGAETGFLLDENPDTVRAPDGAFVRRERVAAVGDTTGFLPGAPDLAIEVISPGDLYMDVMEKVAMWLAHDCQMVIVINPIGKSVVIHRPPNQIQPLTIDGVIDGEKVVPGWRLPVRDLFDITSGKDGPTA